MLKISLFKKYQNNIASLFKEVFMKEYSYKKKDIKEFWDALRIFTKIFCL